MVRLDSVCTGCCFKNDKTNKLKNLKKFLRVQLIISFKKKYSLDIAS